MGFLVNHESRNEGCYRDVGRSWYHKVGCRRRWDELQVQRFVDTLISKANQSNELRGTIADKRKVQIHPDSCYC